MKKIILLLLAVIVLALPSSRAESIIALTSGGRLVTVDSATPGTVVKTVPVAGLSETESLVAIDFRPLTGGLYALGSSGRLYVIDAASGIATAVDAAAAFVPLGSRFGFDFNPTVDRIRVTSDADQNLRLHPGTGALAFTDTALAYAPADVNAGQNATVVGSAYTNSVAGATSTVLYDIDSNVDALAVQDPPNDGALRTVGFLGVDAIDSVGFDISPTTGIAYASMTADSPTSPDGLTPPNAQLFTINLSTGAATSVGAIGDTILLGNDTIIGIAVPPPTRLSNISTRDASERVMTFSSAASSAAAPQTQGSSCAASDRVFPTPRLARRWPTQFSCSSIGMALS